MKKVIGLCIALTAALCACKKDKADATLPVVTTAELTNVTATSATGGGTITSDGGSAVTASGLVFSKTNNNPTLTDSVLIGTATTGSFTSNLASLEFGRTYYIRAYATNAVGTGYGNTLTLNTTNDTSKVRFMYMGQEVVYGIIISQTTGRKWLDRNLGASGVPLNVDDTTGFGHLFQWGRGADGHQYRNSDTTSILATTDNPGHSKFIINYSPATRYDWRNPQSTTLWQGSTGANNPCPTGWKIPSKSEWEAESITSISSGFSKLKITSAGYRVFDGTLQPTAGAVYYWASTSENFTFHDINSNSYPGFRRYFLGLSNGPINGVYTYITANGQSVRCIQE